MMTTLFIISFLLHGVLLFMVLQNTREKNGWKHANQQEMEATLHQFLEEIKQENAILEQSLSKQVHTEEDRSTVKRDIPFKEQTLRSKESLQKDAEAYEPSLQGKVHQLYESGISIEKIAKQLGRGKTEIELMIKFKGKLS